MKLFSQSFTVYSREYLSSEEGRCLGLLGGAAAPPMGRLSPPPRMPLPLTSIFPKSHVYILCNIRKKLP